MKSSDHIVTSFDQEITSLNEMIARMGGQVEAGFAGAIEALTKRNSEIATRTIARDVEVDQLEEAINDAVINMLVRRQPMADDLRFVFSALKIAGDLERIGDHAKNIAKRATTLNNLPRIEPVASVPRMGRAVQRRIKDVLDAFNERNATKAMAVWESDTEIDNMYNSLFRETLTYMAEDPRSITGCTHLLFIAKNIERIGDHATNIAEVAYFLITGEKIEGGRPRGDLDETSSYGTPAERTDARA